MIDSLRPRTANPPATAEELTRLEATLGRAIPSELHDLLSTANGVWIPDVAIPTELCPNVPGGGIGGSALFSIEEISEANAIYEGRITSDLLVFGADDFGNALCIGLHGSRHGKIYFWDHEDDVAGCLAVGMDADPIRIHQNEYCVADSLAKFISLFRNPDLYA